MEKNSKLAKLVYHVCIKILKTHLSTIAKNAIQILMFCFKVELSDSIQCDCYLDQGHATDSGLYLLAGNARPCMLGCPALWHCLHQEIWWSHCLLRYTMQSKCTRKYVPPNSSYIVCNDFC